MNAGDYVLAIDGEELKGNDDHLSSAAQQSRQSGFADGQQQADRWTARAPFRIGRSPTKPDLIYLDWITKNRKRVEEATNGRVGYIHIPDMGADGIREFIKWYYPQIDKEGLVVDVRANGGGNVSRMLIERLRRKTAGRQLRAYRRYRQHLS